MLVSVGQYPLSSVASASAHKACLGQSKNVPWLSNSGVPAGWVQLRRRGESMKVSHGITFGEQASVCCTQHDAFLVGFNDILCRPPICYCQSVTIPCVASLET